MLSRSQWLVSALALGLLCGCDKPDTVASLAAAAGATGVLLGGAGVAGVGGGGAVATAGSSGDAASGGNAAAGTAGTDSASAGSSGASSSGAGGASDTGGSSSGGGLGANGGSGGIGATGGVSGTAGTVGGGGSAGASGAGGVAGVNGLATCVPIGVASPVCLGRPVLGELPEVGTGDSFPTAVGNGDFNGDGKLDLVVAHSDRELRIYLGLGNGTFQASTQSYSYGNTVLAQGLYNALVVGDFNGDSKLDVAVTNPGDGGQAASTLSVLLGNGDGTFKPAVDYGVGFIPSAVLSGDFNGDLKPDLAVLNFTSADISMLLGNGDGTFKPAISDVGGANAYAFAAADFDGDKKLDLVVVTPGTLYVELGLGTGKFSGEVFETSVASFPGSVVVGDFNGDKKPDIAVTGNGAQPGNDFIDVLLGNGDGTFQAAVDYPVGLGTNSLGLADLDGDGKLDLIVTNAGTTAAAGDHVDVLLGNGDGTFQAAAAYGVATSPISLTLGDFNGDGLPDVATANGAVSNNIAVSSDVSVLLGKGDGSLLTASRYGVTAGAPNAGRFLVAGDFNGDCLQDLAIENPLSQPNGSFTIRVSVLLAKAAGGFEPSIDSVVDTSVPDDANETMVAADFDSNGKLDLVVTAPPGAFFLSGNGDGTFQKGIPVSSSSAISGPVDFNADGRADLVESGAVLLGNGDGTFKYVFNTAIGSSTLVIGHFDAGPTLDIASGSSVLLGNGDGTFATVNASNLGTAIAVAGGDLNGDGKQDLLVFQQSSQLLQVALGNGDGTFQDSIPTPPVANFPGSWLLFDVNGDGNLDIVTDKFEQDVVAVLLGHGDGSFASELDYAVGLGPGSMTTANLGALGAPSVVVADTLSNDVTVLNQTSCVP